nr:hypothetical protein BaRGS_003836 [Batillaria attramentaria]
MVGKFCSNYAMEVKALERAAAEICSSTSDCQQVDIASLFAGYDMKSIEMKARKKKKNQYLKVPRISTGHVQGAQPELFHIIVDGSNVAMWWVLDLAVNIDGVVVSNDHFREFAQQGPGLLQFQFVNDIFMPTPDPLGKFGPLLNEFLQKGWGMRHAERLACLVLMIG